MLHRFSQAVIRSSAFLRKEVADIMRQPRLLLTLILGPFLILLIFGIGYRNVPRSLRTLFVVDAKSPLNQDIQQFATTLGPQLIYAGTVNNLEVGLDKLRRGEVDLVAVAPTDAYNTIRSNKQAVFILYHREIDPFQADYVKYFGQTYLDEVNRRVLTAITRQGQTDAATLKQDLDQAKQNSAALRQALQSGDTATAQVQQQALARNVDALSVAAGASLGLLSGVQQTLGSSSDTSGADQISSALKDLEQNVGGMTGGQNSVPNTGTQLQTIDKIDQDLSTLDQHLNEFTSIDPVVLVRPFVEEVRSIAEVQPTAVTFFAPAVIALLLQHLAVTFGALSIVRERTTGTMELFRVSPLSAGETLMGKYVSYMLFGGILAAILSLLLVIGLKVPMLGTWVQAGLVLAALLFASLGYGFLISLLSERESQAVQLTMILLLASVFFSGFLMNLDQLWQPVRVVSWALPTTYGIVLLRDIFLRGIPANPVLLAGLIGIGLGLFFISWLLLRRMVMAGQK